MWLAVIATVSANSDFAFYYSETQQWVSVSLQLTIVAQDTPNSSNEQLLWH